MVRKKIIAYNRVEKPVIEQLSKEFELLFFKDIDPKTDKKFISALHDADGIIGLELPVDKDLLEHAPQLKIVSNVSVGYNNLDLHALNERKVMATNTPDVLTDTVADLIFGLLLSAARRIPELHAYVQNGQWKSEAIDPAYFGTNVHHKKLGIIGMGAIGQAIAKRAHFGFDMDILYHNRNRKPGLEEKLSATYCGLDELLCAADFVCLMTPLTPQTERMIGERQFKLMKRDAIFINGSRGKTIVEEDLINALVSGEIAAAGMDVYENEPISTDSRLLTLDNVVTTPHIGSSTYETELEMSKLAAKNLQAGLNGNRPPNLVNPKVFD